YLETDLFYSGIRPAMNAGLSVSRVGGSAQSKAMKKVAGTLRIDLAQYREMASFSQFGAELDQATRRQLSRGERLTELLKQGQYQPMRMSEQVLQIYAGVSGKLDDVEVGRVREFLGGLVHHAQKSAPKLLDDIDSKGELSEDTQKSMDGVIEEYRKVFALDVQRASK
ncbi:MAG TPA: F0F1 ATP synthase subunit alpha, partial [bacterium]|nr:F0F1 ATP synthase subunit alpha [bacterium]